MTDTVPAPDTARARDLHSYCQAMLLAQWCVRDGDRYGLRELLPVMATLEKRVEKRGLGRAWTGRLFDG